MSRFFVVAVFAITLALAAQANASTCAPVAPTNAIPPENSSPYATWNATGYRTWDCKNGVLVNASQISGTANFTSSPDWQGGFIYINDVARFDVTNTKDGVSYSFDLDNHPGLTPVEGSLSNARWTVNWIGAPPAGLNPGEQYLVRNNSVGGATPAKCPSTKSNRIEIPFNTTYMLYNCEGDVKPVASAVSRSVGVVVMLVATAAAAALF